MNTLLLPCDGSDNALLAVRHAVRTFQRGEVRWIHLLNVQPPFSSHVARHVSRQVRADFQRERGAQALAQARRLLDAAGVPYRAHLEVGEKVRCIADAALRLRCDRILIGTARKSALARAVQDSLTNRLIEHSTVPLEVIGGAPANLIERLAIPASVGSGLAWLWVGGS